ncbi:MAG: hypothetical protein FJ095_09370 [Deltaproteobacteria bacterium]|nr:hypothetical protein [Deltaproteobacteria bacterium]
MSASRCLAVALFSLLAATEARSTSAQPALPKQPPAVAPPTATADAGQLAREGKALLGKGQFDVACAKLDESAALDPKSATLLDLATCLEKQGRRTNAHQTLERAAATAEREKQGLAEKTARARQRALEKQLALISITMPAGTTLALDGVERTATELATPIALEPGEHQVEATTPGKRPWSKKVALQAGAREHVEVPALEDLPKAPVAIAAPARTNSAPPPAEPSHRGRVVVEIGFLGGLGYGDVTRSETSVLDGLPYAFPGESGNVQAACGDTETIVGAGACTGELRAHSGGVLGGQLFVGWSLASRLHAGLRALGGTFMPGGFVAAGGPAISMRVVGPLWLGLGGVVGIEKHRALLVGAYGAVPPEAIGKAGGAEVAVVLGDKLGATIDIDSGIVGGGTVEIAVALLRTRGASGAPNDGGGVLVTEAKASPLAGSLLVGVWPSVLAGSKGIAIVAPAGVSYRFH